MGMDINLSVVVVSRCKNDGIDETLWLPTKAQPGSTEKIEVMAYRASLGLPIFHPLDAEISYEKITKLPNSDSAPDTDSRIGSDLKTDTINQAG